MQNTAMVKNINFIWQIIKFFRHNRKLYLKKQYICKFCNNSFSKSSNLHRHQRTCKLKTVDIVKLKTGNNKSKKTEINKLKTENDKLKDLVNKYEEMNNKLFDYVKNNKSIVNNTYHISVKNYVQQNYPNAPVLKGLNDYAKIKYDDQISVENDNGNTIDKLTHYDDNFIDTLTYNYNNNYLHKYLGDFIIKYYKKDNPSEQSMWSSDTSRLTYIIKELLSTNESIWNHDYKGIKTKNCIVNPLLEFIKENIDGYWINHLDNCKSINLNELNKFNNIYQTIYKIKKEIDSDKLSNDIVRYMAPHFYMNKKDSDIDIIDYFIDND